jgi:hypothetical protein
VPELAEVWRPQRVVASGRPARRAAPSDAATPERKEVDHAVWPVGTGEPLRSVLVALLFGASRRVGRGLGRNRASNAR